MAAPAATATTIWISWQRISDLVAQGINIAGIAQILHLQHRNTELESDNSDLKSENARLRSEQADQGKEDGKPMTNYLDDTPLADDIPAADAAEQHQPADDSAEDAGLDPRGVANLLQRDANPSDVIDQAIIVPLPDDDRDADATAVLGAGNVVVAAESHAAARPGNREQVPPRVRARRRTPRLARPGTPGLEQAPPAHQPDSKCSRYAPWRSARSRQTPG